ncbi:hypothetical protein FBY35_3753 [Streptomyces sp. SLBN-118]|uniref:hypothetical protein n=1 Tax=Streptomyces sp. SLBN-118 TaxID=2768454 RepID=UPI001172C11D|nr:hypothetical protein [Streptomyces sp. SLBN-118]TQK42359.1 hypothetical protein FBY35_3753 [Streptomyces sp. SLBN-118]
MGRIHWSAIVDRARDIVTGYGELGCTLRQVHYRLVAEGLIPNTRPPTGACPPDSRRHAATATSPT